MKILMIDDDVYLRESLAKNFRLRGHEVTEASEGDAAITAATATPFEVVICDYDFGMMDTRNGVEICTALRLLHSSATRFFVCSGLPREVPEWITYSSKSDFLELIHKVEAGA